MDCNGTSFSVPFDFIRIDNPWWYDCDSRLGHQAGQPELGSNRDFLSIIKAFIWGFPKISLAALPILPNLQKYRYLNYVGSKLWTMWNLYMNCSTIRTSGVGHTYKHNLKIYQWKGCTIRQVRHIRQIKLIVKDISGNF